MICFILCVSVVAEAGKIFDAGLYSILPHHKLNVATLAIAHNKQRKLFSKFFDCGNHSPICNILLIFFYGLLLALAAFIKKKAAVCRPDGRKRLLPITYIVFPN